MKLWEVNEVVRRLFTCSRCYGSGSEVGRLGVESQVSAWVCIRADLGCLLMSLGYEAENHPWQCA